MEEGRREELWGSAFPVVFWSQVFKKGDVEKSQTWTVNMRTSTFLLKSKHKY